MNKHSRFGLILRYDYDSILFRNCNVPVKNLTTSAKDFSYMVEIKLAVAIRLMDVISRPLI